MLEYIGIRSLWPVKLGSSLSVKLFFVWLAFLLVFTGKTFSFKNLENAKEKRERKAHPGSWKAEAIGCTSRCILPNSQDERQQFRVTLFNLNAGSLAIRVVLWPGCRTAGGGQTSRRPQHENRPTRFCSTSKTPWRAYIMEFFKSPMESSTVKFISYCD